MVGSGLVRAARWLQVVVAAVACAATAQVAPPAADDALLLQAREAQRKGDGRRLDALRDQLLARQHPLASWADYWAIGLKLKAASPADLDAFYARWPGSYVEDRLRNDWLLELGQRRDWDNFRREQPRFRMADDLEVDCYTLLLRHQAGEDVQRAAADAWLRQRRDDDGCTLMARTLVADGRFGAEQVWPKVRLAVERGRSDEALAVAALLGRSPQAQLRALLDNPARWLATHPHPKLQRVHPEEVVLALLRLAAGDSAVAATQAEAWEHRLPPTLAARAWAGIAQRAALRLEPAAADHYARAFALLKDSREGAATAWPDDTLAWAARAALRAGPRWALLQRALASMPPALQSAPEWRYWAARALQAQAAGGEAGAAARGQAEAALRALAADPGSFYGLLALEDLGGRLTPPAPPPAPSAEEQASVRAEPGLQRALQLIALGLRSEGVREWNFSLRDLRQRADADRALLAAAAWACERAVWDRCINTSERAGVVDLAQRYPTPLRDEVQAKTRIAELESAYVYGLIRQESRFITDVRSAVGASGLMQLMPATARWTARKIGLDYRPSMIDDPQVNLRLGTAYLKLLLDDFEGAQPLAIASYNAGPNRPRRWREGPLLEPAIWIETIPFNETRDYVKKVLTNAVHYAHVLGEPGTSLKARLGAAIGPRRGDAPVSDRELP